jgi:hypothetical protein
MQGAALLLLVIASLCGLAMGWLLAKSRAAAVSAGSESLLRARQEEICGLRSALEAREAELSAERCAGALAREEGAELRGQMAAERRASEEKLQVLVDVEKNLKVSFEALAASALDATAGDYWGWRRRRWVGSRRRRRRSWRRRSRRLR